jgi:hypothetical protein
MTKILGWIFAVVAVVFGFPRVRAWLRQGRCRRIIKQVENSPLISASRFAQDNPTPVTRSPRGYDSPEVFRKDTLVRIKILQLRIEENAKRISKITQRIRQYKKVYDDRTKRMDDEDENE